MIDFTVTTDTGDTFEVSASSRDILNWEKTTKGGSLKTLMESLHMGDMYKVAHFAARRTGQYTGTLQEFEAGVDLVFETESEEGSEDPTR